MAKSVLVFGAHDDDCVIGVGGILRLHHRNDRVHSVVFTDGQNSHKAVLGITENPSQEVVRVVRRIELEASSKILGARMYFTYRQYSFVDGELDQKEDEARAVVRRVLLERAPDVVYFHSIDGHADHRTVSRAVKQVLREEKFAGEAYTFSIWSSERAQARREVDPSLIESDTGESQVVDVRAEVYTKRMALFAYTSQVQIWPYTGWQIQERAILDKKFLDSVLGGEEIITPVKL